MTHTKDFDLKRNEIINCAEHLFMTRSYELTTVNMILKEVGIAKGTFYYYFDTKEEVMDAVIMRIVQDDVAHAKSVLERKEGNALNKLIEAIFKKSQSSKKEQMIEQLYETNNALMKQRALQRTIELVCPIYAEIIEEGNKQALCSSKQPLIDIQFLLTGLQTLLDLSKFKNATIEISLEQIIDITYRVLQVNENKITKQDAIKKLIETI